VSHSSFSSSILFDISPEISSELAVFPGDTPFSQKILMDCNKGDGFGLSSFTSTPHLGAHVDAPNHYAAGEVGISQRSLEYYFGPCQVIEVNLPRGKRISVADLGDKKIIAPRVLFKTKSFPNPNQWNKDFNSLSPELVDYLADQKVMLVGIDTPSIDLSEDKVLSSHHKVHERNLAILEGIVLTAVPEGFYILCALPLKMKGLDASPVRAVLLQA
jgi:arylformamidase